MAEGASIGAVVQTIMESLSEAISQLMLFVIAMQESNAAMPAHIPTAAQGVTDASNTLADVASSIAEEEYEGYPDIQIPILDAAKDVRASGINLTGAVNNLKSAANKAEGWARLQDACGVISAQTCYILQLVYAAELKRMLFATEAARDLAGQTQAALAAKDPQKFADQVSELAGHADALADSLLEKIQEEESPLRREELKKQAAQLKRIAEDLPKLANDLLRDPKNVQAQKAYNDKVKEFEKLLDEISKPFESKLALLPDKPPQVAPTPVISPPTKRVNDPPVRPGPTPHQQANAPPPRSGPPPPNNPPRGAQIPPAQFGSAHNEPPYHPTPQSHAPPPPTVIPQAAKKAKDDLRNLIAAAGAKNTPNVVHEAKQLAADVSPIVEALEHLAKQSKDPERVNQLQKTAEEVKKFTPKAVTLSAAALKDPKQGSPELQKMVQKLDALMDFANDVAKPAPDVEFAAIAKELLQQLPKLVSAPSAGVQKEKQVEETAKKINDLLPFLAPAAKEYINKHTNPQTKAKLTEALRAAEGAIPESINNARAAAKNAKDVPTLEKAKKSEGVAEQALKDMLKGFGAEVLAQTRKQKDDVAMLDVMATMEQPKQVAAVEKEIAKRHPHLAEQALELANNSPGTTSIGQEVKKIDEIIPEQIQAAHEVVNKPNADPPKKKLKQNTQEMAKALDNIAAEVQNAAPPTTSPNLPSVQELLDALQAAKDPKNENKLQNLLDKLAPALEKMLENIPDDDPESQEAERIVALGRDLQDTIDQIVKNAPASNNPKDIEKFTKDLPKKGQEFIEAVKPFIEKFIEDPEVKALLKDALDDLAALLPEIITTANEVAKNPRDPRPRKKLDDLGNAGNKNVNFVIKKINRPPEEKKEEAKRRFPKAVKKVLDALDKPNDLDGALDRLKKVIRDMNPPTKDPGPNYLGNKNIAEAIKELEKALEEKKKKPPSAEMPKKPFDDAKKFFENLLQPNNTPKSDPKDDVIATIKDVENLLDRLEAAALSPNPDPTKLANVTKSLGTKVPPLIQAARKAAEAIKDPQVKKKLEDALKNLEKELPRLINEGVKPVINNPTPEAKEKLKDVISDFRAPLDNLAEAVAPDPEADLGKKEKQEAAKLARAAKNGDPKAAQDALKAIKDLNDKFVRAAKEKAAQAPPKLKDHLEQKVKELEEQVKAIEPVALEFAKKPNDAALKENLAALANSLSGPIDAVVQDLQFAPQAIQSEKEVLAKQILASIKAKNIKKLDPSHLLKISKHLAGLISDMVSKTGDELHSQNQSELSERARAALELEKLLSGLERDAAKSSDNSGNYAQSIDALLSTLNLSGDGGQGASAASSSSNNAAAVQPTHLSQQVTAVAKQIRTKTSGSIDGTPLHAISQSLAADLQKFADADNGNSRSELIVLGRTISASIVKLADELKRLAAACTDPKMQEKLLMNAQVLRNYATQLKIMASVRAAAPKHGNDSSSDQLVILTQNLAAVIGDATNAVSIIKQTKKGNV